MTHYYLRSSEVRNYQFQHITLLSSQQRTHLKNIVIKEHHDDAGYVEGRKAGVYDEVAVVEQTGVRHPVGGVVQSEDDGRPYRSRYHPHERYRQPHSPVVFVLGVLYRLSHRYVPEREGKGAVNTVKGNYAAGVLKSVSHFSILIKVISGNNIIFTPYLKSV